jgi:hypothetical protein
MKHRELIRRYYECRIEDIAPADPPENLIQSTAAPSRICGRFTWEDILGLLITAGYLSHLLLPANWFSFNRFLFVFRFGF